MSGFDQVGAEIDDSLDGVDFVNRQQFLIASLRQGKSCLINGPRQKGHLNAPAEQRRAVSRDDLVYARRFDTVTSRE